VFLLEIRVKGHWWRFTCDVFPDVTLASLLYDFVPVSGRKKVTAMHAKDAQRKRKESRKVRK